MCLLNVREYLDRFGCPAWSFVGEQNRIIQYNMFGIRYDDFFDTIHMTIQQRRDRVVSLTTSPVMPLNLVTSANSISLLVIDNSNDCGLESTRLLHEFIVCIAIDTEPFSNDNGLLAAPPTLQLRDWARCFFKLASVVPGKDRYKLWLKIAIIFYRYRKKNSYHLCNCMKVELFSAQWEAVRNRI